MKNKSLIALGTALVLTLASAAPVEEDKAEIARVQRPSYPLAHCVVTGKRFDAEHRPVEFVHNGRLFLLASAEAGRKIEAEFEPYAAKINAAVIEHQKPIYPMETCAVSGEKLGSMGAPVELVHGTRLVRLCCKGCRKAFYKQPDGYLKKVDDALIARQRETYPMDMCLVSGEKLGSMGDPIDRLHGVTLVRFCCKGCIRAFDKSPEKFVAKVLEARGQHHKAAEGAHHRGEHDGDRGHRQEHGGHDHDGDHGHGDHHDG
jgi:YHS domain-containing protein